MRESWKGGSAEAEISLISCAPVLSYRRRHDGVRANDTAAPEDLAPPVGIGSSSWPPAPIISPAQTPSTLSVVGGAGDELITMPSRGGFRSCPSPGTRETHRRSRPTCKTGQRSSGAPIAGLRLRRSVGEDRSSSHQKGAQHVGTHGGCPSSSHWQEMPRAPETAGATNCTSYRSTRRMLNSSRGKCQALLSFSVRLFFGVCHMAPSAKTSCSAC